MAADLGACTDAALAAEIKAFAATCPGASYLQDPDWPAFAPDGGGRHSYRMATVRDASGALVLAGLLRRTSLPGGVALGAFRRGPMTRCPGDLVPALTALLPRLKAAGFASVTLNPRWYDDAALTCEAGLAELAATPVAADRQTLHNITGLVDLDAPLDEILAGFSKKCRPVIRKLEKSGLTVRAMTGADVETFAAWRAAFVADRRMSVAGQPSVSAQFDYVRETGGLAAMADLNGETVGAFIGFRDGDRILPIADAWADPNARLPRGYLFLWSLIRAAHAQGGIRWLDIGGLSDQDRLRARDPQAAEAAARRDDFKMQFRPRVVTLPRVHEIVLRPMTHRLVMAAKKTI